MKPCSQHRQSITWMALGALDKENARQLRAHLETCPACRQYCQQVAAVCQDHQAAADLLPQAHADESFHRQLRRRIEADAERPVFARMLEAAFRLAGSRMLPVTAGMTAAVALLMAVVWLRPSPSGSLPPTLTITAPSLPASPLSDPASSPTLAHYRLVANASLDSLDELLTRQAVGGSSPGPGATFSPLSRTELEN
jgi:hypothetical protein